MVKTVKMIENGDSPVSPAFKFAIVRRPCPEMVHGITSANLGKPDFGRALDQHHKYVEALKQCGLTVHALENDSRFPDSVFIEDVALCTPRCAVITNPGAPSRRGETAGMHTGMKKFYSDIVAIGSPGTLEAGDVMMVGSHYYIGLSERTNGHGAGQLIRILKRYGMTGSTVQLSQVLHLKTGVSYLENNNLLVCGEFTDFPGFEKFNRIEVSEKEAYAVNSLWLNGTVLVPDGFPDTLNKIESAGYPVIAVDVSEFQKLDGGLSCLSLRF